MAKENESYINQQNGLERLIPDIKTMIRLSHEIGSYEQQLMSSVENTGFKQAARQKEASDRLSQKVMELRGELLALEKKWL